LASLLIRPSLSAPHLSATFSSFFLDTDFFLTFFCVELHLPTVYSPLPPTRRVGLLFPFDVSRRTQILFRLGVRAEPLFFFQHTISKRFTLLEPPFRPFFALAKIFSCILLCSGDLFPLDLFSCFFPLGLLFLRLKAPRASRVSGGLVTLSVHPRFS